MSTRTELDVAELDAEQAQMLPERSALAFFNFSDADLSQSAWAATFFSEDFPFTFAGNLGFNIVLQD